MKTQLDQVKESRTGADAVRSSTYERPILTAVGNLHDLLALGGTQNADPGGPSGPICHSGGVFFDGPDCT